MGARGVSTRVGARRPAQRCRAGPDRPGVGALHSACNPTRSTQDAGGSRRALPRAVPRSRRTKSLSEYDMRYMEI